MQYETYLFILGVQENPRSAPFGLFPRQRITS